MHLTLNYSESTEFDETVQDSFTWNDSVYTVSGDYVQTFVTINGCDSVVTLHLTILTGIDNLQLTNPVSVYPNPASSILNIECEEMQRIDLYNADGQLVYTVKEPTSDLVQIDVSRYAAGQYFVKITLASNKSLTKKVIVNHQ